jgi:hypothetical protein
MKRKAFEKELAYQKHKRLRPAHEEPMSPTKESPEELERKKRELQVTMHKLMFIG